MSVNGIQYELVPYEPDVGCGYTTITHNGNVSRFKRYLIPCRPTIDHVQVSQYNLDLLATPVTVNPLHAKPSATVRLGIYRNVRPIAPLPVTALTLAEFVKGSDHTTTSPGGLIALNTANMTGSPMFLGGGFWICLQLEDTTVSGSNYVSFVMGGMVGSDATLTHAWFTTTGTAGTLPTTIAGNIMTVEQNMPFVRADWI